ncbi:hypothetical protein BH09DEP1_BH09DEP1_3940 [soil metagenome]
MKRFSIVLVVLTSIKSVYGMDLPDSAKTKKLYASDFAALGVQYSTQLIIDKAKIEMVRIAHAAPGYETPQNITRFDEAVKKGYQAPLYIKYINERMGYGAFADLEIKDNDIVGEYTGNVIDQETALRMPRSETDYLMELTACYVDYNWPAPLYVDAKKSGNLTRFVNHSYKPNVATKLFFDGSMWHTILVAAGAIAQDKQLFINYTRGYWDVRGINPLDPDQA